MVFKPFTYLVRPVLAKGFTHGYAQSVVAASQSSYASQTTSFSVLGNHSSNRLGKSGAPPFHNAFTTSAKSSSVVRKAPSTSVSHTDGGLAAYYAAWQQEHEAGGNREWTQFQFAKRIGYTAPAKEKDGKAIRETGREREEGETPEPDPELSHRHVEPFPSVAPSGVRTRRSHSVGAADDIRKAENREATLLTDAPARPHVRTESLSEVRPASSSNEAIASEGSPSVAPSESSALPSTDSSAVPVSATSDVSSLLSSSDVQASPQLFHEQLRQLHENHRFREIPAVFEAMLRAKVTPEVTSYNALLTAAIHVPTGRHQAVSKALDVYADMMHRNVVPDTTTFSNLIELLSVHARNVIIARRADQARRIRVGGLNHAQDFLAPSTPDDGSAVAQQDALTVALQLFETCITALKGATLTDQAYSSLLLACADEGRVVELTRIFGDMQSKHMVPNAAVFPPTIDALGAAGQLDSVVHCFEWYTTLADAAARGEIDIGEPLNEVVYASVVYAYLRCQRSQRAWRFFHRLQASYAQAAAEGIVGLTTLEDIVIPMAFVRESLERGACDEALRLIDQATLSPAGRDHALAQLCAVAADAGQMEVATTAFESQSMKSPGRVSSAASMLALFVRSGQVEAAAPYWDLLASDRTPATSSLIEPSAQYAAALIDHGWVDDGLAQMRRQFRRIRSSLVADASALPLDAAGSIHDALAFVAHRLASNGLLTLSPRASSDLLAMAMENGVAMPAISRQVLAGLGPDAIRTLSSEDLRLVVEAQAETIAHSVLMPNVADVSRFADGLQRIIAQGLSMDETTHGVIERSLLKVAHASLPYARPDLLLQWRHHLQPAPVRAVGFDTGLVPESRSVEELDPYASRTDMQGSRRIGDDLVWDARTRTARRLDDALVKLRQMHQRGWHPRYITYARMITAAGEAKRFDAVEEILRLARQDVPLLADLPTVRYGWTAILDAMIGACLLVGRRDAAARYHQELLELGSAPTPNTYGLYITTLDTIELADEATEAVNIYRRSQREGVAPSPFLFNALIGKLGKARRIDDVISYFGTMRELGMNATSVTYGTVISALCRVHNLAYAEQLLDEMEQMRNFKPRPAPYNSLIQHLVENKHERSRVLTYLARMRSKHITPTAHTYKLLMEAYGTLEPIDLAAAEGVLDTMRAQGTAPEATHYASLIHTRGCYLHDIEGARRLFEEALADTSVRAPELLYQAMFESLVANHRVVDSAELVTSMRARQVDMTSYMANALIHGWAQQQATEQATAIYQMVHRRKREPSLYESMVRAYLGAGERGRAQVVIKELMSRGYPPAVTNKIRDLVKGV
ncbi:MAG: hypothetical protein M1838_004314 [Thelocarpon superellum]|nr:MAG: hypothetical protein M1838_004314 [Thelocarpon superellum]